MDRRDFMRLAFLSSGLLFMKPFSGEAFSYCYPKGVIYTKEHPGRWKNKVKSHVPEVQVNEGKIQVITHHPMSKRHYIVKHTLVTADGRVIGEKTFYPEDERAFSLFNIKYKGRLYVTSFCNLHDLWLNEIIIG